MQLTFAILAAMMVTCSVVETVILFAFACISEFTLHGIYGPLQIKAAIVLAMVRSVAIAKRCFAAKSSFILREFWEWHLLWAKLALLRKSWGELCF